MLNIYKCLKYMLLLSQLNAALTALNSRPKRSGLVCQMLLLILQIVFRSGCELISSQRQCQLDILQCQV